MSSNALDCHFRLSLLIDSCLSACHLFRGLGRGICFGWAQLISGSWDGTAKVWDVASGSCLVTLGGHENGVCVLGLPDGKVPCDSYLRLFRGRGEWGVVTVIVVHAH